ncbi:MAG: SgcJ/EcaC family oxidoreductase, partial [Chromatiales bacterium]|nr:SgcJ/EcaC family oxidoreductase [Chromatiales bacterium]
MSRYGDFVVVLLGLFACLFAAGCSATALDKATEAELDVVCQDPRPQMCTMDYRPVCGLRDTGIRCVTTPCPSTEWKTYSNGCTACSDAQVFGYVIGECSGGETASRNIDDQVWAVISRTVEEDDIQGMAAVYHPDAVLVSEKGTVPIADQLGKWGRDMEAQKLAGTRASVQFKFDLRQDGPETAFQTGVFRYSTRGQSESEQVVYVRFESLLVKKDGKWLILM